MFPNRYPKLHNPLTRLAIGSAAVLTLVACGTNQESADATSSRPTAASASSSPGESRPPAHTVCDGFFSQLLPDGTSLVVGRPVIEDTGHPGDVVVNGAEVQVEPRPPGKGAVTWFTLSGTRVNAQSDIPCHDNTPLYPRSITQPNGTTVQVASSKAGGPATKHWDANALDPNGFAGVGLDYGPMPQTDLQEILAEARR